MQHVSEASDHDGLFIPRSALSGAAVDEAPADASRSGTPPFGRASTWSDVPWRTIVGAVAVVAATYVLIVVLLAAARVVMWIAIAGFMAIVLAPLVRRVNDRTGGRRTLATGIVVATTLLLLVGVVALFVMPVKTQLVNIITDLPGTVHDAANGRGPVGNIVHDCTSRATSSRTKGSSPRPPIT